MSIDAKVKGDCIPRDTDRTSSSFYRYLRKPVDWTVSAYKSVANKVRDTKNKIKENYSNGILKGTELTLCDIVSKTIATATNIAKSPVTFGLIASGYAVSVAYLKGALGEGIPGKLWKIISQNISYVGDRIFHSETISLAKNVVAFAPEAMIACASLAALAYGYKNLIAKHKNRRNAVAKIPEFLGNIPDYLFKIPEYAIFKPVSYLTKKASKKAHEKAAKILNPIGKFLYAPMDLHKTIFHYTADKVRNYEPKKESDTPERSVLSFASKAAITSALALGGLYLAHDYYWSKVGIVKGIGKTLGYIGTAVGIASPLGAVANGAVQYGTKLISHITGNPGHLISFFNDYAGDVVHVLDKIPRKDMLGITIPALAAGGIGLSYLLYNRFKKKEDPTNINKFPTKKQVPAAA